MAIMKAHGNGMVSRKPIILKGTMRMSNTFKRGDFVRVNELTHEESIPRNRLGHILEEYKTIVHYTDKKPVPTGIWKVFMTNGEILRFHEMFLEHANMELKNENG
jgi:hypothetical protein